MEMPYALDYATVRKDGREILSHEEVLEFITLAVRKRLRRRPEFLSFKRSFILDGRAHYTWNFLDRYYTQVPHYNVGLEIEPCVDGFRVRCANQTLNQGYPPSFVLSRIRNLLHERAVRLRPLSTEALAKIERKRHERRKRAKKRRHHRAICPAPAQVRRPRKERRRALPAPLSLLRNEKLMPQFRAQRFFWREAAIAVVTIFQIRDGEKRTALQKAAGALHRSLERNGGSFAVFKRRGFALRFDLVDGIWRGDITPLHISATKKNGHPLYRRMRAYFRDTLGYLSDTERRKRNDIYATAMALPQNAVMHCGRQYAA